MGFLSGFVSENRDWARQGGLFVSRETNNVGVRLVSLLYRSLRC
jgi:hypothetical protein